MNHVSATTGTQQKSLPVVFFLIIIKVFFGVGKKQQQQKQTNKQTKKQKKKQKKNHQTNMTAVSKK